MHFVWKLEMSIILQNSCSCSCPSQANMRCLLCNGFFFWYIRKQFIPKSATKGRARYEQSSLKENEPLHQKIRFSVLTAIWKRWSGWVEEYEFGDPVTYSSLNTCQDKSQYDILCFATQNMIDAQIFWLFFFPASLHTSQFLLCKPCIKLMMKTQTVPFPVFILYQRKRQGQKSCLVLSKTCRQDPSQDS